jgi:2-polyprenyl-6-hydroxyphenyl methylase / 3-demethylubiquinone-9 3-methyltransferase
LTAPNPLRIDNDVYNRLAHTWWDEKGLLNILKAAVNPWRVPYFRFILTELQIEPKSKPTLDVGCGGGLLAEEFAAMGFAVTGIDPSNVSIAVARAHAAQNGLRIDFRVGYGDDLPFEDQTFEVAYCCDVLEHIPNWDQVIGEIARVLKPNGIFLYDTINRTLFSKIAIIKMAQEWRLTRFFPPDVHVWEMFIRPEELIASLERHGFENRGLRGTKLGNPLQMLRAMRQYKNGKISSTEFGRRIGFREGPNLAGSYMGYAAKL